MIHLIETVKNLSETASKQPYYKFNQMWSRQMQDAVFAIVLGAWFGGFGKGAEGQLITIDEVGQILGGMSFLLLHLELC